jgi:hypothetical protein
MKDEKPFVEARLWIVKRGCGCKRKNLDLKLFQTAPAPQKMTG